MARVQRGRASKPPRILVYGTEGIGKSTFGAQAMVVVVFVDALHLERVLAEFAADESNEQAVEVAADRRRGVDHARALVGGVRRVEPNLRLAMQAFRCHQGQDQRRFNFLKGNARPERVAVDVCGHWSLSKRSGRRAVVY